jgi:hypothetical protein
VEESRFSRPTWIGYWLLLGSMTNRRKKLFQFPTTLKRATSATTGRASGTATCHGDGA